MLKKNVMIQRVATIAGDVVSTKGYVTSIDLMMGLGWLGAAKVADWRKGKIPYLEKVITASLGKISKVMKAFRCWALHSNLKPSVTVYKHKSHKLRFSKSGDPNIETAFSTHYVLISSKKP